MYHSTNNLSCGVLLFVTICDQTKTNEIIQVFFTKMHLHHYILILKSHPNISTWTANILPLDLSSITKA
jgi:hypothetical protein